MSDTVLTALIVGVPPTLLAIATLVASLKNATKLQDVHLSLNSRLTELVAASNAQGRQDERDESGTVKEAAKIVAKEGAK